MKAKKEIEDKRIAADIGQRIIDILGDLPGSLRMESEHLGYRSPSTIYAVKKGQSLPDIVKLWRLAGRVSSGQRPNIDWIVTGEGDRMIQGAVEDELERMVKNKLLGQPREKLQAILTLLDAK